MNTARFAGSVIRISSAMAGGDPEVIDPQLIIRRSAASFTGKPPDGERA